MPIASERDNTPSASAGRPDAMRAYWRSTIRTVLGLLVVWFVVSYGFGILLVEPLNQLRIGQAKLGFWIAQQGSIYVFVVLIGVYVVLLNRLDRRFGVRED